jgi:WhiB family redox-sensing transcriptional regulator
MSSFSILVGTAEEREWMEQSSCKGMSPSIFHPEEEDPEYERRVFDAKAICHSCAVESECLVWALTRGEKLGVWGGKSEQERRRLRRKKVTSAEIKAARR